MSSTGQNTFKISVKRSTRSLDGARKKLAGFFNDNGVDVDIQAQIDLALYEIVANIIEHAGKTYQKKDVLIVCILGYGLLKMTIQYSGREFDIATAPLPDIEAHASSGKDGGLGVYIVRTLMDRVEYSFRDGTNLLTLTKTTGGDL